MTAAPPLSRPSSAGGRERPPSRAGHSGLLDLLFRLLCQAAAVLIILVALFLVVVLVDHSLLAMRTVGISFLTERDWNPQMDFRKFGALSFVWGTVATSAIAMALAVPLGVGTAAYLSEVASVGFRRIASFFIEMLAAIPSVVYGFWGIFVLAPLVQGVATALGGPNTGGRGILTAGLVLAVMIVPYIAAITYDVCQAVPRSQREGALALGATRWQTIWGVVLPYARPGIIAGAFLALGRALGETMAVTMLIGNERGVIDLSPFAKGDSIASILANLYQEADYDQLRSVLVELALLLMAVTVVINAVARYLLWRISRHAAPLPSGRLTQAVLLVVGLLPALAVLAGDAAGALPPQAARQAARLSGENAPATLGVCLLACLGLVGFLRGRRPAAEGAEALPGRPGLRAFCAGLAVTVLVLFAYHATGRGLTPSGGAIFFLAEAVVVGLTWGAGVGLAAVLLVRGVSEVFGRLLTAQQINHLMTGVLFCGVVFTMGLLVVILTYLLVNGATALNWAFFTELPVSPTVPSGGGLANAMVGSVKVVGFATLLAVPVGLLAAIYLAEYRPGPLARSVRFIAEMLGGVPSIVVGIFAAALFHLATAAVERWTGERIFFFGWAGVFALAVMMVPIVMRAAEEALKLVPQTLRNASYALGSSQAQTILRVTVPAALPAIVTAIFLSIARIAGETAPLLITAGTSTYWPEAPWWSPASLCEPTPTLPPFIFKYATGPSANWNRQAWAGAFVLMVAVLVLNFGIRLVTGKRVVQAARAD
jgi:phosphate ABC transporter permease protein PstC/phosphate ABC transporter permease subunit PstA